MQGGEKVNRILSSQWRNFAFWVGAILVMVVASLLYQPAAAKTGSLLVWTRNRVYVMDIDTLALERVGPAPPDQLISPSPGCRGVSDTPCLVLIGDILYQVDLGATGGHSALATLPVGKDFRWANEAAVSWSPDGQHLAYSLVNQQTGQAHLQVYDVSTRQVKLSVADVDPLVAAAWSPGCQAGFLAPDCKLGYKKMPVREDDEFLPALEGYAPATEKVRRWFLSPEPIFELRWTLDGELLYSRPKRFFKWAADHTPAYHIPPGSQLANLSPYADYTVYYQPFTLKDCQPQGNDEKECLHLGVWLTPTYTNQEERSLLYDVELSNQKAGLNFIPVWSPHGDAFVFFQEGRLIYYDLEEKEATIWYRNVTGKLKSKPVFSPNEEAVAFVDNQGQGHSEYRLVVVNPRLQPVEHIIQTEQGFKLLAWLPN